MISISILAGRVALLEMGATLPEGSHGAVAVRLQAAHQEAWDSERDRLIALGSDVAYTDGREETIRAILTRAFGKFTRVTGTYGEIAALGTKGDIEYHIGSEG